MPWEPICPSSLDVLRGLALRDPNASPASLTQLSVLRALRAPSRSSRSRRPFALQTLLPPRRRDHTPAARPTLQHIPPALRSWTPAFAIRGWSASTAAATTRSSRTPRDSEVKWGLPCGARAGWVILAAYWRREQRPALSVRHSGRATPPGDFSPIRPAPYWRSVRGRGYTWVRHGPDPPCLR